MRAVLSGFFLLELEMFAIEVIGNAALELDIPGQGGVSEGNHLEAPPPLRDLAAADVPG